jgi:hypothetical protein
MVLKARCRREKSEAKIPAGRKRFRGDFFARIFALANLFNVTPVE